MPSAFALRARPARPLTYRKTAQGGADLHLVAPPDEEAARRPAVSIQPLWLLIPWRIRSDPKCWRWKARSRHSKVRLCRVVSSCNAFFGKPQRAAERAWVIYRVPWWPQALGGFYGAKIGLYGDAAPRRFLYALRAEGGPDCMPLRNPIQGRIRTLIKVYFQGRDRYLCLH